MSLHKGGTVLSALLGLLALAAPAWAGASCAPKPLALELVSAQITLAPLEQLTQAWACKDSQGDHIVTASRLPASDKRLGTQLLFVKRTHTGSSWKKDWQARDFLPESPMTLAPVEIVTLKDADGDGLAETFIAYALRSPGALLDEGKLLVFYKDQKYAIRGAIPRTPDDFGSRKISPSFLTLPASVQAQALLIWDKLSVPASAPIRTSGR
jgi:hypothetical protein